MGKEWAPKLDRKILPNAKKAMGELSTNRLFQIFFANLYKEVGRRPEEMTTNLFWEIMIQTTLAYLDNVEEAEATNEMKQILRHAREIISKFAESYKQSREWACDKLISLTALKLIKKHDLRLLTEDC